MGYNFPDIPTEGLEYTPAGGVTYVYNAPVWKVKPTTATPSVFPSDTNPGMNGAAAPGVSALYSRGDHIHPTDSTRAPLASPVFTGDPKAPTPTPGDNDTSIATTAFVTAAMVAAGTVNPSNANPLMDGVAAPGTSALYARGDHAHPSDTSREPAFAVGTTAQYRRGDKTWQTLDKVAVGLANVDNTSDANKPVSSATTTALNLKEDKANKAVANGYASLDASAKVPAAQLPSYVDDVLEFANFAAFPATGTAGVMYVALDTNKIYRWSGSAYVEISPSPGSTDSVPEGSVNLYYTTARASAAAPVQSVAGRQGAVVLTKTDVGLGNVDNTSDVNKPVSTAQAAADALKVSKAGDVMTGALQVVAGTVANASIYFDAINTGIYGGTPGNVQIASGGTNVVAFNSSAVNYSVRVSVPAGSNNFPSLNFGNLQTGFYGVAGTTIAATIMNTTKLTIVAANITSTVPVVLPADPTNALEASTKQYVDTADGLKAPLASPVFTGDPKAPTPTIGDSDTSIATTAFVQGTITLLTPVGATVAPLMDGAAAVGVATKWAREDHRHPTDTAKADKTYVDSQDALKANIASPTLTGVPAAPTAALGTSTTQLATTAFVAAAVSGATGGTIGEAPNDGQTYGRKSLGWTALSTSTVLVADTAPASAPDNSLWWQSDQGDLWIRFNDGTSTQWVAAVPNYTIDPALANPLMDSIASVGLSVKYAREDHVHPSDTTKANLTYVDSQNALKANITYVDSQDALKAPLASPTFTGDPKAPTPTAGDNDTSIATTAFVTGAVTTATVPPATVAPLMDGVAAVGTTTKYAREDHKHPTDTSREPTLATGTTAQYYRGDKSWQTLDKTAVGLANVDNTSDANKPVSTATQIALNLKEDKANKGVANGYAPLDASLKVPAINLPAYVDDVVEYANFAAFPGTGTAGLIYVALDTNKIYRWSGSAYIEISPSPGSTDSVPEGSTNLYYTNARASAAAPVQSVAGRTGAVVLTKTDVGLANVDNTSDVNKPVSTATQTALNLKADLASPALTGNPTAPTPTAGDSDTSIATTAFVTGAVTTATVPPATVAPLMDGAAAVGAVAKYAKEDHRHPTDTTREPTIAAGTTAQYWKGDKSWATLDKAAIGLGNVDNTSDANKPISSATQTALNAKEPTIAAGTAAQYWQGTKTWQTLDKAAVGLGNVDNTSDANKPVSTATQTALNGKANTAHSHVSTDVSDFAEAVDDRVGALLQAGANVSLTYNDAANTLIIAASGGGSSGAAVLVSDTAPVGQPDNTLWWDSDSGRFHVRYNDGDSTAWVQAAASTADFDTTLLVKKTGDSLSGPLLLYGNPTAALEAVPKQFVDKVPIAFPLSGKPVANASLFIPMAVPLIVPGALVGTVGYANTAPTANTTFTLNKISGGVTTALGTITATAGSKTVFNLAGSGGSLAVGDAIQLLAPASQDTTLADIGITILMTRA